MDLQMEIKEEWPRTFLSIKSRHDLAYRTIEMAIRNEELEQPDAAIMNYKLGISFIDKALNVQVAVPDDTSNLDDSWSEACKMIQKMKRTRDEVVQRLITLNEKNPPKSESFDLLDGTTSVECDSPSLRPRTYFELSEELRKISASDKSIEPLYSCNGVKLFYISDTGSVTTSSEDSTLRIVQLAANVERKLESTYFLQIIETAQNVDNVSKLQDIGQDNDGLWLYPLYPSTSPCFRTDFGAFVFPDLRADQPGAAIGILVPSGSDEIVLEMLDHILHGIVTQGLSEDVEVQNTQGGTAADTLSRNLIKGAHCISYGLVKGSEKIGQFVTNSTPYLISKLASAPESAPPVSERVANGVEIAKSATTVAANVTGYVAGKVGSATAAFGKFLAPHVHKHGSYLLSSAAGFSEGEASETMDGVLNLTAGAVVGVGTVSSGLLKSAGILGNSLSNNSVKIIEHKYGPSVGEVAADAFDTFGNIYHVTENLNYITPKGLAKAAVKQTSRAVAAEFQPPLLDVKYVPAGSLFPDLSEFAKAAAPKHD